MQNGGNNEQAKTGEMRGVMVSMYNGGPHSAQTQTRINTSSTKNNNKTRTPPDYSRDCYIISHLILDPTTLAISPLNCTNKTYGKPGLRWSGQDQDQS